MPIGGDPNIEQRSTLRPSEVEAQRAVFISARALRAGDAKGLLEFRGEAGQGGRHPGGLLY